MVIFSMLDLILSYMKLLLNQNIASDGTVLLVYPRDIIFSKWEAKDLLFTRLLSEIVVRTKVLALAA